MTVVKPFFKINLKMIRIANFSSFNTKIRNDKRQIFFPRKIPFGVKTCTNNRYPKHKRINFQKLYNQNVTMDNEYLSDKITIQKSEEGTLQHITSTDINKSEVSLSHKY